MLANVYDELAWMQAYGRETVVIKISDVRLPSDLVRTGYIAVDQRFTQGFSDFLTSLGARAAYYETLASACGDTSYQRPHTAPCGLRSTRSGACRPRWGRLPER